MEHLIADSGIHFITEETEFIPSEPLRVDKKALKYYFAETTDIVEGYKTFNILCYNEEVKKLIPVNELRESNYDVVLRRPSGREEVDLMGMIKMAPEAETSLFTTYEEDDKDVYSINSLLSFHVPDPNDAHNKLPAFELLLDKWLPIPMFKAEKDGVTRDTPLAWCRMKMTRIGAEKGSGKERFRLVYAFDTQTATDEWDILRPYVSEDDEDMCVYKMCNRADLLLINFMSSAESFHAFSDYIASILGIDTMRDDSLKYKAFYVYFLNFIRLLGCSPEVTLHNNKSRSINVDLVLDIGNSRTCGILFQESDFTKGKMLELRDLTYPHIYYENETYDMRIVFRKADFGNDIVLGEDMFQWRSFVRIGEEARRLVYSSTASDGIAEKTTYYSSPKRYLWDMKKYGGQWENLITNDDPSNVALATSVAVPGLTDLFAPDGTYDPNYSNDSDELIDFGHTERHYSRSSLMTFAFIEIFQHALAQINSIRYRYYWGDVNIRRVLRNVIITCPPAMPLKEQIFLRKSANDAYEALIKCIPTIPMACITPSSEALKISDPNAPIEKMTWKYDEATCCQLVYLYAEIAQRYGGETKKFFDMKGHKSVADDGTTNADKELTIGTIDIGAGTTDMMICSYAYNANNHKTITPTPLFYDSFYLAGDDILRNIVQNIVIEGKDIGQENIGNITSALTARICAMTDDELQSLPCLDDGIVYKNKVKDILTTIDKDEMHRKKVAFASNLIHDFFGTDSSMMSYKDRQCRNDFNTQISVAIAQKMLELVRTKRPSKLYTYEELFPAVKPAKYLLDYFEHHFGFRFETLSWRYNPEDISAIVKSTMEPLLKQLSVVLYSQKCDIIVLGGRPTSLDAITELFIKYLPVSPDRLVRLNDYQVGSWFPAADGNGYFYDQKAIVAVGAMIGYLASRGELKNLTIDFTKMIMKMTSTANYMGEYNKQLRQVQKSLLSPTGSSAEISASSFPIFIGCRQLDSPSYQARPLYAIYNNGSARELNIRISRDFSENKEELYIEEVTDNEYRNRKGDVELVQQSLVEDGKYWLDKGEFELTIKK